MKTVMLVKEREKAQCERLEESEERMVPREAGKEQFQKENKFKYPKSQVKSGLKYTHQA